MKKKIVNKGLPSKANFKIGRAKRSLNENNPRLTCSTCVPAEMINDFPIGILSIDKNGNILTINSFLRRKLDFIPEKQNNRCNALKLSAFNDSDIPDLFKKCMNTDSTAFGEYKCNSESGTKLHFKITSSPIFNEFGRTIGCTSVFEDISTKKRAEEMLKNHFQLVDSLINTIPSPIYYTDKRSVYIGCNNSFAYDILGIPKNQIIGKSYFDLPESIPPEFTTAYHKFDKELLAKGGTQKYESKVKRADGTVGTFIFSKAVFTDSKNEIIGIAGVMLDVTDHKKADQLLIEKTTLLESLLESIPEMIFFKDIQGNYLGCNPAFSEYSGLSPEDLIGKTDYDIFDKETANYSRENDLKVLGYGSKRKNEEWVTCPDGRHVLLETYKAPLHTQKGKLIGTFGVSHDITARKLAENELIEAKISAEASNRAKSDFIANVSHELRTPLNSIIGFSEILHEESFGPLNENQGKYVSHVLSSSKHLLNIINNILDISKIENDSAELYYENIDIASTLEEVLNVLKPTANKNSIELKVNLLVDPLMVEADKNKILQILYNLIGNAIKFTPRNGYVLVQLDKNDDSAKILVQDTGIGIPDDKIEEIFLPFKQLDSKANRKYAGTGLGLALVKKFTDMHKGEVKVNSEPQKGSAFSVIIPLKKEIIVE
jgi:PAS domain S-box-containing protein